MIVCAGGNCKDPEDAQENQQCGSANRACWDFEKHVSAVEEDDQRADWVVDWTQIHAPWWRQYQPVYLYGMIKLSCDCSGRWITLCTMLVSLPAQPCILFIIACYYFTPHFSLHVVTIQTFSLQSVAVRFLSCVFSFMVLRVLIIDKHRTRWLILSCGITVATYFTLSLRMNFNSTMLLLLCTVHFIF